AWVRIFSNCSRPARVPSTYPTAPPIRNAAFVRMSALLRPGRRPAVPTARPGSRLGRIRPDRAVAGHGRDSDADVPWVPDDATGSGHLTRPPSRAWEHGPHGDERDPGDR